MAKSFTDCLRSEFHLSIAHIDKLSAYFRRRWSIGYFLDQMDWNPMEVEYQGIRYTLVFLDNLNWKDEFDQVHLSFRVPTDMSIKPVVLVKGEKK